MRSDHSSARPREGGDPALDLPLARKRAESRSLPLSQRVEPGERDLLVLVRLHAGDADRANAFALNEDRQAALDRQYVRKV